MLSIFKKRVIKTDLDSKNKSILPENGKTVKKIDIPVKSYDKFKVYQDLDTLLDCPDFNELFSSLEEIIKNGESSCIDAVEFFVFDDITKQFKKTSLDLSDKLETLNLDSFQHVIYSTYLTDSLEYYSLIAKNNENYIYLISDYRNTSGYLVNIYISNNLSAIKTVLNSTCQEIIAHYKIKF